MNTDIKENENREQRQDYNEKLYDFHYLPTVYYESMKLIQSHQETVQNPWERCHYENLRMDKRTIWLQILMNQVLI